ncbi:DUF1428 domain-containing protein [Simiduia agarivorans]|uniref:RNA signal recognition particle 4.5S RNA n=1 Tax=Simiduia agarivorans (strain DSM 21679 / JCM 13881 / BCRC 17597 / SA1) TaxID=1117647 RepID=K4KKH1_SIMAS|nr:DUF1428 domain-containing protein [Simiduia agarivorans]AFU99516.1 hypothetical protein M5M_11695 [Simiduia agarivorans SA1 = DSM 21679]
MSYVDGYVLAVPLKNKTQYIELAEASAAVFKDHGAIAVVENWADDVPEGEVTSLPMAVKCEKDEVVVFSWIIWPSREARDAGNKAVMEDPRFADWDMSKMPFDGKRMIFGGFNTIVNR